MSESQYQSYFLEGSGAENKVEAWKRKKWGCYSGSQIFHLMVPGKETLFSPGGITYIESIAREGYTAFNEEESVESYAMKMGKVREPQSFAFLQKMLGFDGMEYYGGDNPYFHKYCKDSGVSPDAVAWKDKKAGIASFGAELKNPTGKVHMHYLRTIKDHLDLKKQSSEYYNQCQMSCLAFNTDHWLWCSHNEFFPFKDRMLIIEIPAEKNHQTSMSMRIKMAVKNKYEIIEELKNR